MTGQSDSLETPPPTGTTWTGEWDEQFGDRIYGADPVTVANVAALLTGVQHRTGATVSGVALRVTSTPPTEGHEVAVIADLTPAQARELADALLALAARAESLDGIAGSDNG